MLQPQRGCLTSHQEVSFPHTYLKALIKLISSKNTKQSSFEESHSFTGLRSKIQPFQVFVGLEKVHRRVNKMIRN